jgi:hypothetical protein
MGFIRDDQPIAETLVVSLAMIMRHEFVNPFAQRALAEEDHTLQAGFLDAAYESLSVGVVESRRMQVVRETPRVGSE